MEALVGVLEIRQSAKSKQERIAASKAVEFAIACALTDICSDGARLAMESIATVETEKEIVRVATTITTLRLLKEDGKR